MTTFKICILFFLTFFLCSKSQAQWIIIPIFYTNANGQYNCVTKSSEALKYFKLGNSIRSTNRIAAANYYKQAIIFDGLFCDAYHAVIQQYLKLNELDSALKFTELALNLDKTKDWLLLLKGKLLLQRAEAKASADHFYNLMQLQSTVPSWMYYHIESLIMLNELDSAQKMTIEMEKLLRAQYVEYPTESYFLQAKIAFFKNDYKTALKAFELIRFNLKKHEGAYYYYGLTLLKQEIPDGTKARKYIKKASRNHYKGIDPEVLKQLNIS